MRKDPLLTNQYYHIYNRGVDKRDIFMTKKDLERFVLSVKEFNTVKPIGSIRFRERLKNNLQVSNTCRKENKEKLLISIVCFCFNPNHFHFIIKQEVDGGISEFFKKLLGGYTNYFNKTYNRTGSLFQGRFKSNLIKSDPYFLKIRPYVNINYLIHNIPKEKKDLILASDREYNNMKFNLVSKKEASKLLSFYKDNKSFSTECLKVISMIREERGNVSLLEEEKLR